MPSRDPHSTSGMPTPIAANQPSSTFSEQPSSIDEWSETLIQNVRGLSSDADRLYELTQRGF